MAGLPESKQRPHRRREFRCLDALMVLVAVAVVAVLLSAHVEKRAAHGDVMEPSALDAVERARATPVAASFNTMPSVIQLCQYVEPACDCQNAVMFGVDCQSCTSGPEARWKDWRPIPWQMFAQGEYVGPHRSSHVPEYRLRVDDQLEFVYRITRIESGQPYQLNVGDRIRVESLADKDDFDRELVIQPDGAITLRLLGQVPAAGKTIAELTEKLEKLYQRFYNIPSITVTPLEVNTKLNDLRNAVDSRFGTGGQSRQARVTPEGTVQLPAVGSVYVQGLSIEELNREIDERYKMIVEGLEVTPVLLQRAPRFAYVLGEVVAPGRYSLEGPTTVMQAIALAGGWNNGGNLRELVVFRRGEDWRMMATKLDLNGALLGKRPCPADEIWLRDSDVVIVPKSPILLADDFIDLVFTRGIYGVVPFQGISLNFAKATSL